MDVKLSYLKKRLFLAESKLQRFEAQYGVSLAQLEAEGLPDDADYIMHEDYLMWHHWADAAEKIRPDIAALEEIVQPSYETPLEQVIASVIAESQTSL